MICCPYYVGQMVYWWVTAKADASMAGSGRRGVVNFSIGRPFSIGFSIGVETANCAQQPYPIVGHLPLHIQGRLLQEFAMNLASRRATEEPIRVANQQSSARL